jgi:hypothetical protein
MLIPIAKTVCCVLLLSARLKFDCNIADSQLCAVVYGERCCYHSEAC